ncbi:MAG: metallophosphoesterase [Desulfohalobiaceae bacterium]
MADLHLGVQKPVSRLRRVVSRIQDLEPELILFGGDLVNDHPQWLQGHAEFLAKLAVLGNHDLCAGHKQALCRSMIGLKSSCCARRRRFSWTRG